MKTYVQNLQVKLLSTSWGVLKKLTYDFLKNDGTWESQVREVYDRGDGAAILLYNTATNKIIITKQFRIPTYVNGNPDGQMIEACAGKIEEEGPEMCVRREAEEETGYRLQTIQKAFAVYMSPGSVTEIIHGYVAPYDESMKISEGGGLSSEQENIEVLEMDFAEAFSMINSGLIKDGKTIMLLQFAVINQLLALK
jgi:GDP-mannose pyrophosphatase NudK